jgi:hypothetical protein
LILVLANLSVCSRSISPFETSLAPTAHKEERLTVIARVKSKVPLMLERLLGRVLLPLSSGKCFLHRSKYDECMYLHLADFIVLIFLDLFIEFIDISK